MEAKIVAIISYLGLPGWIIALILNQNKQELASFHIRQSIGIMLFGLVCAAVMIIPILGWIAGFVGYLATFVFWIMGLVSAIKGDKKEVPLIGAKAQEWFKSL